MMEPSPKTDALHDRLMSLRPAGLSTRAWTINAGVSSAFFDNIAAGGAPREGELPKVLAVVGMTLAEFEGRRRANAQAAQPTLPTLRVMPRAPKPAAETAPQAASAPDGPSQADAGSEDAEHEPVASGFAEATAEALARWLEARSQASAAGLETTGPDGARLVTDLARLALDIERLPGAASGAGAAA